MAKFLQQLYQFHCPLKLFIPEMTHTRQSFLIPELNIVANDAQLKNLQHKILFDHYSKESQQKINRSESQRKIYRNYYNPEQRADTQVQYENMKNSVMYNKSFGIDLAESYQKEMDRKEARKRQQKESQRRQEQMMIQAAQTQLQMDKMRAHQYQEIFKKQAIEQLQMKQMKKAEERRQLQLEKQAFQRRYSTNLTSLAKQESFRKHYNNVNGAFQQNQRNYLSFVAPANRQIEQQKDRLIQNSIKQRESKLREQLQKQFTLAERHRNDLRDSLVMQIRQKQQKKKQEINQMRSQGYTSNAYLNRHHPINNPVDFKITHDNRYIIKELQSGLARSGSQSILS